MKLFYIIFALLLAVVLGAPPKITVPPAVIQDDGITEPTDPLKLGYCCKTVWINNSYQQVCGDLCPKPL